MGKMTLINVAVLLLCVVGLVSEAAPDCSGPVYTLLPCYPFLTGTSSSPPQTCCVALAAVAASQPVCLCEVIGYGNITFPVTINVTRALELTSLCNVAANPSQCPALINAANGAPAGAPITNPLIPRAVTGSPPSGASRKIPGLILSIVQFVAVPAVASLLLRVYY